MGQPAFQIASTAAVTVPITICVQAAFGTTAADFALLKLMHNEGGVLVDRTVSRDFPTLTICAQTNSLSPFALAVPNAPTASGVSVSGRVLDVFGQAVRGAIVVATDDRGASGTVRTNSFGAYRIDELPAGSTVVVAVVAKARNYAPLVLTLNDNLVGVDLVPASTRAAGK